MNEKLLKDLTELYVWGNPKLFKDPQVNQVKVVWFSYYSTWRVTITRKFSTGDESEQISNDPVCQYIIDKCFDKTKMGTTPIVVSRPSNHECGEAVLQLQDLLNLQGKEIYAKQS